MFGIGGLTGLVIPDVAAYAQYHATMYVVGHFHYTFMGGAAFGVMAVTYFYLPKMTGVMPDEKLGSIHFWVSIVTFNIAFMLMMIVGLEGMPRFASDYPAVYATMNLIISTSAIILGATQLLFFVIVIKCARGIGPKAAACAWEGAEGLEWTLPSPVPYHTWTLPPVVK
jgi:cytochrome c oxidase subunit 1